MTRKSPVARYLHGGNGFRKTADGSSSSPSSSSSLPSTSTAADAPYALVTGATSGMGEEWAKQLAALGFNVILHGRCPVKLERVKREILEATPSVDVVTAVFDASQSWASRGVGKTLESLVDARTSPLRITVLVNNVGGMGQTQYPALDEISDEDMMDAISANALFPALLAKKCLPKLKRDQPSLMVNIGSLVAEHPPPFLAAYTGSKGFNRGFSHSLHSEMIAEGQAVDVVCMLPGGVINGNGMMGNPSWSMPLASKWVESALASLAPGFFSKRLPPVIRPYSAHRIQSHFMGKLPTVCSDGLMRSVIVALRKAAKAGQDAASEDDAASASSADNKDGQAWENGEADSKAAPEMSAVGSSLRASSSGETRLDEGEDADQKAAEAAEAKAVSS